MNAAPLHEQHTDQFSVVMGAKRGADGRDHAGNMLSSRQAQQLRRLLSDERLGRPQGVISQAGMLNGMLIIGYADDFETAPALCFAVQPAGNHSSASLDEMRAASTHLEVQRIISEHGERLR